jgi:hypothetical protein
MPNITIATIVIRQDKDGRFCLNDLHQAAGGEERHSPNRWTRTDSYQNLVDELTPEMAVAPVVVKKGGASPGTYVVKELVYAYAMWISPKFHLQVIRTFDDVSTGKQVTSGLNATKLFPGYFKIARLIGCDKNSAAISANNAVRKITGDDILALLGHTHLEAENQQELFFTPTELGERIGVSGRSFNLLLAEAELQVRKNGVWTPLPAADGFYRILDTGKKHSDGSMVQQVKWAANVLELINREAA